MTIMTLSEKDFYLMRICYGNTVQYFFNKWGAPIKTLPSVGLATTKSVQWADTSDPAGTLYSVLTQDSLSTYSKQYIDYKGRVFKTENESFDTTLYTESRFNEFNQVDKTSTIYQSDSATNWNSYTYRSNDGRLSNESYYGGASVSYTYNSNEIIKSVNSRSYTSNFDAMGNVTSVEDPLNLELDYTYHSSGGFKSILGNGGTMSYYFNDAGLDTMMVDPSHGTSRKSYNSLGQVTWSKDGKGNEFDFTYDTINRLTRMENSNNSSEYYSISYVSSGNGKGQVYQKSYTDGSLTTTLTYSYDSIGRIYTESKQIGAKTYSLTYHYSDIGRLDSISDSNGKSFSYTYNNKSFLTKIYFEGTKIWELESSNLTERKVKLGSNITLTTSFDDIGQVTDIDAGNLFDMSFSFNDTTGSLISRTQRIFNLTGTCTDTLSESFTYDDLDRLLEIRGPNDTLEVSYDTLKKERIYSKTDAGSVYEYDQSNPFLLESIDTATSVLLNRPDQSITYTSFNKVDSISEGNNLITFDYGPNQERVKMKVERNDTLQYTRYYFGSYELTEYPGGDYEKDTWFSADGGLIGFNRVTNSTDSIYYVIKAHLGSVMTVAGEDGNAREFFSYDAWGRRRVADDWTYDTTLTVDYTSRGYTGHEHMDETWLINMNGRVYDPVVGLFLSPDPFVQSPMNPLNYNRYTYVLNNPLKYTDPSGNRFVPRDYQGEYMVSVINDITRRINDIAQNRGGSGGGGGRSYHAKIASLGGSYSDRFITYTRPDGSTIKAKIGVDVFIPRNFLNFYNDLKSVINGDDFSLSFEFGNEKLWIIGTTQYNEKSLFGGLNSSNFERYVEASVVAAKGGGGFHYGNLGQFSTWLESAGFTVVNKVQKTTELNRQLNMANNLSLWEVTAKDIKYVKQGSKLVGFLGPAGDGVNISLILADGAVNGVDAKFFTDLVFAGIGCFPIIGDGIAFMYMVTPGMDRMLQEDPGFFINANQNLNLFKCFVGGSQVTMADGTFKNIELVQTGDSVLTYNFEKQELEINSVLHIDSPVHYQLVRIVFSNGEEIVSTEDWTYPGKVNSQLS